MGEVGCVVILYTWLMHAHMDPPSGLMYVLSRHTLQLVHAHAHAARAIGK